ncbi:receptor-like protein 18 [Camellia sinensis]|uniref:receptor-like protein 18 n=1 Tax=Camellia sinensis TaxID=4442 RepID=UPI0010358A6C|nr:receptor-like protein 18 [Camellia sinensis]
MAPLLQYLRKEVLDLRRNKNNGILPYWLGTLLELQVLVLRFNRFHGHTDTFKTKSKLHFPKLRIIDISYNEFTGLLPANYISRFEAMMNVDEHELKLKYMGDMYYKDYVVMILKGHEIEYSRILRVISIIDLSSNKFIGEILKSIGRLNSLRGLNLSHNNLKGHIPTSLGNLSKLESLDLSSNQLVGEIP